MTALPPSDHFSYFDHIADIGIIGRGETLELAFCSAAEAMFAIMTDIQKITPQEKIVIRFQESDSELALVIWLNQLLTLAITHNLVLSAFTLKQQGDMWQGEAWGELWRDNIIRGIEVKGATLTMLKVFHDEVGWQAQCVVDV